jgi:tetratricopeptide (TPR) repeat protein
MAYTSEIEKLERRWNENPLGLTFAPFAEACRKAGDHTRALELLEIGLAQHPNYVPAHIVRGRCHLDVNNEDAAELAFLRVIELDPENAIALRSLADICERTGRVSEAVHRLETLIEVDRSNEDAKHQLHRLRTASAPAQAPVPPPVTQSAPEPAPEPEYQPRTEPAAAPEPVEAAVSEPPQDDLSDLAVFDPGDLDSGSASEFQLPSDSESLSSSGDRLPDIVLGSEITEQSLPLEHAAAGEGLMGAPNPAVAGSNPLPGAELAQEPIVPEVGSASGEMLGADALPDLAASATAWAGSIFEPTLPVPETAEPPEPPSLLEANEYLAEEREFASGAEAEPVGRAVDDTSGFIPRAEEHPAAEAPASELAELSFEPGPDAQPEPEPEPEPETEPEPVPAADSFEPAEPAAWWASAPPAAPEASDVPAPALQVSPAAAEAEPEPVSSGPEPALVVTESMAEVFLRQGLPDLALAVYTQLAQRDPENQRVTDAVARLRAELAPPAPAPAPPPRYDAASTGGTSIAARLGDLLGAARPAVATTVHPPAFEAQRPPADPTRPAEDSLSLSSVFGEETGAPVGPASGPAEPVEGEPSFDEFFAPQETAELPSRSPAQDAAGAPAQSGEDLERFNAWLRGLKG